VLTAFGGGATSHPRSKRDPPCYRPDPLPKRLQWVSPRRTPSSLPPLPPGCHRNWPTRSRPASRCPTALLSSLPRASPPLRIGPLGNAAGRLCPRSGARRRPADGVCPGRGGLVGCLDSWGASRDTHGRASAPAPAPTTPRALPIATQSSPRVGLATKVSEGWRGSLPAPLSQCPASGEGALLLPGTPRGKTSSSPGWRRSAVTRRLGLPHPYRLRGGDSARARMLAAGCPRPVLRPCLWARVCTLWVRGTVTRVSARPHVSGGGQPRAWLRAQRCAGPDCKSESVTTTCVTSPLAPARARVEGSDIS
jgi:hypothetical protein